MLSSATSYARFTRLTLCSSLLSMDTACDARWSIFVSSAAVLAPALWTVWLSSACREPGGFHCSLLDMLFHRVNASLLLSGPCARTIDSTRASHVECNLAFDLLSARSQARPATPFSLFRGIIWHSANLRRRRRRLSYMTPPPFSPDRPFHFVVLPPLPLVPPPPPPPPAAVVFLPKSPPFFSPPPHHPRQPRSSTVTSYSG